MNAIGRTRWLIPGVRIPERSTGPEPAMTSRETVSFLNTAAQDVDVELRVHQTDGPPLGPYRLTVAAHRMRRVRLNDLVDPQPLELGTEYALDVLASGPVVVQWCRLDSSPTARASLAALATPLG